MGRGMLPEPGITYEPPWNHARPTHLEHRAESLARLDPVCEITRTSEVIQVRLNSYEGIVVLVTSEAFEIRLPTIEWTRGTHAPVAVTRIWRRVRAAKIDITRLRAAIEEAAAERRNEFSPCRFCGEIVPIEHRLDDVCHGCASQHLGVVF